MTPEVEAASHRNMRATMHNELPAREDVILIENTLRTLDAEVVELTEVCRKQDIALQAFMVSMAFVKEMQPGCDFSEACALRKQARSAMAQKGGGK